MYLFVYVALHLIIKLSAEHEKLQAILIFAFPPVPNIKHS